MLEPKGVMEPYREPARGRGGWLTLVVGALVFAGFGAVVGYAYFNGLPSIGGEPPVIRADSAPYRRAPDERGGLEVANASSSIVSVLRPQSEPPRVERLLPPETPLAVEESGEEAPAASPGAAPRPSSRTEAAATPPAPPPPAATTPEPAAPTVTVALPPSTGTGPQAGLAAPAVEQPLPATAPPPAAPPPPLAPMPAAKPPQLAALEPPAAEPPARAAPAEPPPPPPPPPPTTAVERVPPPPAVQRVPPPTAQRVPPPAAPPSQQQQVAPQRQARVEPTAPAPPPPPRQLTPEPPAAPGVVRAGEVYRLQLAAVRTDGGLTQAWAQLKQRYPEALGTVGPRIERTDTTSGPLFRLQAGPFGSREAAADACSSIRGGGGQCFIVGPVAP